MIINSQFFITYYMGNNPLPLITPPTGLTVSQNAEYQRFIQNIGAIYGSQTTNGKIPKFWTKLTQTTDSLGNVKYSYIPHPDSDLQALSSKSAYYFIVRDESAIPLKIPSIGGSLLGFTDSSSLPNVLPLSIPNFVLTSASGNTVSLAPIVHNLQPYEEYTYQFKSVSANWPVTINPESGILKPSTYSGVINAKASFCLSSGECGSNSLDYTLAESCTIVEPYANDKYAIISLSITPKSYIGPETLSDQFTLSCKDCLPKPNISLTSTDSTKLSQPPVPTGAADFDFTISVNNLQPNQTYHYSMETIDAQWPTVFIGNCSGSLYHKSPNTTTSLAGKLVFCYTTGICRPNASGINPYSVPKFNYPKFWNQPKAYNVLIRAALVCSTCPTYTVYSDPILLSYEIDKSLNPQADLNIDTK